ncbi:MAG: flavodoxin family protein, partial [Candidatus Thorarchaeota archaeon]
MKAIILHGSPRRDGNSDTLAHYFANGLRSMGHDEIVDFYANEMDIEPCQMCMTCQDAPGHKCTIDDDMTPIYEAFKESEIVVFSTPMLWGYMTAQLKVILDRMEALAVGPSEWWTGKKFVGIFTYWHHYETMVAFFERICPFFDGEFTPLIYCSLSDDPTI